MTPIEKVRAALKHAQWIGSKQRANNSDGYSIFTSGEWMKRYGEEALRELDGMVLVPVEPDDDMWERGYSAGDGDTAAKRVYKAMIAPYLPEEKK